MEKYHTLAILGFRFIYGIRTITPFSIGMSQVSRVQFLIFDLIAAMIWSFAVGMAGYLFGAAFEAAIKDVKRYELFAMLGITAVMILFYIVYYFGIGKKRKNS